jgi:hypothetical protein
MLPLSSIANQNELWQAQADHLSKLVVGATILVAIGVALEGIEFVHDMMMWIKRLLAKRKEHTDLKEIAKFVPISEISTKRGSGYADTQPVWVKVIGHIGLILVVVGVVGEWRYGAKFEHTQRHLLKAARDEANDAAASAQTAHEELNAVRKEADALKIDLASASKELSAVEFRTLLLDKREKLLVGQRRQRLLDALKPFAGQKVDVRRMAILTRLINGPNPTSSTLEERDGLARSLIGVLNEVDWNAPKVLSNRTSVLPGDGVSVHLFPNAPLSTLKAAGVLIKALGKVPLATSGPTSDLTTAEEPDKGAIILVVHLR